MPRRRVSAALRAVQRQAKADKLAARANLIAAGILPRSSRAKFHNTRCTYNGMTFDSLGEAEYAHKLDLLVQSGEVVAWEQPPPVVLVDAAKARDRITYRPDFHVIPREGWSYYVDYKGSRITETAAWKLKVKLWRQNVPFELRVAYPGGEEKVVCTGDDSANDRAMDILARRKKAS